MSANKFLSQFFPEDMFYRFNDKILEIGNGRVLCEYTFPQEADFYIRPGNGSKIAPASVITEIAIQGGPVVLGKYHLVQNGNNIFSHDIYLLSSKAGFNYYPEAGEKVLIKSKMIQFKEDLMTMRCAVSISSSDNQNVLEGEFTTKMIESNKDE